MGADAAHDPDAGGFLFFHKNSPGDWEISLHPAIDYFITSSVSLGAVVGYRHSSAATGTTALDLGARAGFNLNINDHVGVWPTAGLGVNYVSADYDSSTTTTFGIFAPFLYHLVPHLFVGLGPSSQYCCRAPTARVTAWTSSSAVGL